MNRHSNQKSKTTYDINSCVLLFAILTDGWVSSSPLLPLSWQAHTVLRIFLPGRWSIGRDGGGLGQQSGPFSDKSGPFGPLIVAHNQLEKHPFHLFRLLVTNSGLLSDLIVKNIIWGLYLSGEKEKLWSKWTFWSS